MDKDGSVQWSWRTMQPNEIKRMFHIATNSSKIPGLLILGIQTLYIYKYLHISTNSWKYFVAALRANNIKWEYHFHILNKEFNVLSHL